MEECWSTPESFLIAFRSAQNQSLGATHLNS